MTQDEIVKMARQAGLSFDAHWTGEVGEIGKNRLEAFAKLVAQRERDELFVMFMEAHEYAKDHHNHWHFAANKIKDRT